MSLLETKNKKFNVPFVFIAGVLFLLALVYFANYLEQLGIEDKVTEKIAERTEIDKVYVRIKQDETIYVNNQEVSIEDVERQIKENSNTSKTSTIQLVTYHLSSKSTLKLMETLRNGQYNIIVEVSSK